jgi:membrane protease YdiL (CAAX protease family)
LGGERAGERTDRKSTVKEKLRARDVRFIAICALIFGGTVWFSARNFHRAFPEASIDFRVDRGQGEALGRKFLLANGYRLEGFRQASSFTYDEEAKTFLEREAGLERANRIMSGRVRLWRWSYRWFRPLQKEEFRVDITPQGALAGFRHEVAEDAARPAVSGEEARALAENFLRTAVGRELASLEFVDTSEIVRPHRVDRVYSWKERDFAVRDATTRVEVTVLGNEVGGYSEYLKVPDQWKRDYQRLRSKNEVAATIDSAVMVLMLVGLVVIIVTRVRRRDVRWRQSAWIGLIGMALSFCSSLNQMPLDLFRYPTTDSYASFLLRQLLQNLVSALAAGGLLFVLAAGAEPVYREAFPDGISLGNLFLPRGLRTRRFLLGSILGITLTGVFIAYQTGFYMVAYRFGAWSPADVPYSDLLNTKFPWAFVLFGGFLPAVSEEFLFRMFGIPFIRKLSRSVAIAVVAAGFIWGFGHATYPQQPFYIRGVEVGIGGVALGLIMLRWGILPTLVWHYSVDAIYSALLLMRSQSLYFKLSGAASAGIAVLPVILALAAYWIRGGFEFETGLLNRDQTPPLELPKPAEVELVRQEDRLPPLDRRARVAAVALAALGLASLALPIPRFGGSPRYRIGEEQAQAVADAFLRNHSLDPASFRQVTVPEAHWGGDDSLAAKYFLERGPVPLASALFEKNRPLQHWVTRCFRSLDKEEVLVSIHPESGHVLAYRHTLPEDRSGADLAEARALDLAAAFASGLGQKPEAMDLKEVRSEKKKARRDYTFIWEARSGDARNLADARFRMEMEVAGDSVSSYRCYWHLPEAFARARAQQNFFSILAISLRCGLLALGVVIALWLLLRKIREGRVPWRTVIRVAIPVSLLTAVGPLLSMQLMLENYNTAIPFETYEATIYMTIAMSVVVGFVAAGAAAALILAYHPEAAVSLRAGRRQSGYDPLWALLAALGLALLFYQTQNFLKAQFHAGALFSVRRPELIISRMPVAAAVAGALRSALIYGAALVAAELIVNGLRRRWMLALGAALAPFLWLPLEVRTAAELALQYAVAALALAGGVIFCRCFARKNCFAYILVLWLAGLWGPIIDLLGNPYPAYLWQGRILLVVALAGIAGAAVPGWIPRTREAKAWPSAGL